MGEAIGRGQMREAGKRRDGGKIERVKHGAAGRGNDIERGRTVRRVRDTDSAAPALPLNGPTQGR